MPILQSKCESWKIMMKFKIKMVQSRDSGEKNNKKQRMGEVIISSAFIWKLSAQ